MKTKNIFRYTAILFAVFSFASCDDFLDYSPNDRDLMDNFLKSPEDLQVATGGLYNQVWFDFNDKFYFGLGEGRGNNLFAPYTGKNDDYVTAFVDLAETSLTGALVRAWQSFYNVIAQSNNTINSIKENAINVTEEQKNAAIAEARFMRGAAYWYIASLWGDAIIIENNSELIENYIVPKNPRLDVMEFAIRDLEFAAKHLPEKMSAKGRLTKYSAFGMLSRVYLSMAGLKGNGVNSGIRSQEYLDLAANAAWKVISESEYKLMSNYADLFTIENNNNSESLFALQWIANGDYGVTNTQQAYFAYSSTITGDDAAWGQWTIASYDMMSFYDSRDQERRKATWMGKGDEYKEINKENGGLIVDNTAHNMANVKKGVVGSAKDNEGKVSRMNSALNTYMLRLAEVYLNYAEAVLGNNSSTTDANALYYFNQVRTRAGMPAKTELKSYNIDNPYGNVDDIHYERRVELTMEGQYWYDLVRRSYYRQTEVLNYMNLQDREREYTFDPLTWTITKSENQKSHQVETAEVKHLLLPIPESEVSKNPKLKEDPVPYLFSEDRITDLFD